MIERALVWEPTNPYCWMLWADWFLAQGHRDARESTLREMMRLFPGDLHARVELARLLIDRGEEHWFEAEHWLRQAMNRNPGNEHSHVVMARLLVLRHRRREAETLLEEFVERHPDNTTAQQYLGRLRAVTYVGTAADVSDDPQDNVNWKAIGRDVPPNHLTDALRELFRRGRLAGEFNRAQIARVRGSVVPTDLIRQETLKGDPLAGFYSQWLTPEETPECPPHAWAWNACRHWQESASADRWRHLATQFPEAVPETEFLRVLATMDDDAQARATLWRARYGSHNGTAARAVDAFMREAQERPVFPGRARTRRARRSGDGLRVGGRSRIRAGTRCLKAWFLVRRFTHSVWSLLHRGFGSRRQEQLPSSILLLRPRESTSVVQHVGGDGEMNQTIVSTEYGKPPDLLVRQEELVLDVTERLTQALDNAGVTER